VSVASGGLLVARSDVRRDDAVLESLFAEHYSRVYGVVYRLTGDRAEAEDLAVETFARWWRRSRTTLDAGAWLYRVATRLGYNATRSARRRARLHEAVVRDADVAAPVDPAQEAQRAEERARVRAALARLPARQARLLVLRHSGLSYKEVASALRVAPASIGALLARAERAFERAYASLDGSGRAPGD
jgi:RNA polymerase sigma-70 factor (ECF subfamily)